ncbi:MAG: SIMPL domain-containing protein [Muribaculaceae bacterium]|nr:SIMPL domain-containing protein [Muribaculaceae bacterium]MDE5714470.1 SIMPL domain-containing protein [Muribaculaceae bacterium]
MDSSKNKFYFSATTCGLLIGIGLLLLGVQVKRGLTSISDNQRVVTVRGLSEKEVAANKVTWPIVSKEVGNDLPSIYSNIEKTNAAILSFLKTNGIKDSEISVNAPQVVDMQADRYNSNPLPYRYNVTNVVVVTSSQVDNVRKLIERQTELLKQGIAIVAGDYQYQTTYEYTDLNTIKPGMIADATKNAREAANKFADDSDSELGKIKTASQGQFSIEDRDQYTPYIKRVRVVSTIVYYLKD